MRAIQEAGVKIDVVGGRGIGAIAAVLGAVDGGSQLWDHGGFWRSPAVETFYRWRWPFMVLRWLGVALLAVLAIPAAVILLGLIVYPIALLLGMAGLAVGALLRRWLRLVARPRVLAGGVADLDPAPGRAVLDARADRARRRRVAGVVAIAAVSPLDRQPACGRCSDRRSMRAARFITRPKPCGGCSRAAPPSRRREADDLSRRYAELLAENLGQPGFRELLLVVHDLDANRDLVFGLVREPYRRMLFPAPGGVSSSRRAEAQDLSSGTQGFLADVLAAALTLPGVSESRLRAVCAGLVLARRNASPDRSAGEHRPPARRSRGRGRGAGGDRRRHARAAGPARTAAARGSTASAASASRSRRRRRRRWRMRSGICIIASRACT